MILTTILAVSIFSSTAAVDTVCPIMHSKPSASAGMTDFAGIRFGFCCPGCEGTFTQEPGKYLKVATDKKLVIGTSLFDPVSGKRVVKSKLSSNYKGVAYVFDSAANKKAFDSAPAKYTMMPKKVVLTCPISHEAIENYADAAGYWDVEGIRYYVCCADCHEPFTKDAKRFADGVKDKAVAPPAFHIDAK